MKSITCLLALLISAPSEAAATTPTVSVTVGGARSESEAALAVCSSLWGGHYSPRGLESTIYSQPSSATLEMFATVGEGALFTAWPGINNHHFLRYWIRCLREEPDLDESQIQELIAAWVNFASKCSFPADYPDRFSNLLEVEWELGLRRAWFTNPAKEMIARHALDKIAKHGLVGECRRALSVAAIAGCTEILPVLAQGVELDAKQLNVMLIEERGFKGQIGWFMGSRLARTDPQAASDAIGAMLEAWDTLSIPERFYPRYDGDSAAEHLIFSRDDRVLPLLVEMALDVESVFDINRPISGPGYDENHPQLLTTPAGTLFGPLSAVLDIPANAKEGESEEFYERFARFQECLRGGDVRFIK